MTYPSMPGLALFAAPAIGRTAEEVVLPLRAPGLRVGERLGDDLPKHDPETGMPLPLLPCPFSAIALASGPAEDAIPTLRASLRTTQAIDIARSVLLVGATHVVRPGDGAILVTMLTRRQTELTRSAYRDRWLNEHALFGLRIDAAGYRQLHVDDTRYPDMPNAQNFDGAGMVFFYSPNHAASARAAPEVARDATRDEMQFIDHAGSMLAMFRLLD